MAGSRVAHTGAQHMRRPGWPGVVSRIRGWRNTCGGQDGRESCRAYGGATHAKAMGGRESRRRFVKKAARRWLQAEKCDFGEIQELRLIAMGPILKSGEAGPEVVAGSDAF